MITKILVLFSLCSVLLKSPAHSDIDGLLLAGEEIPAGYALVDEAQCISVQACGFYDQTSLYEPLIGKVKSKKVQNFKAKKDDGAIMYFEFEKDFDGEGFLSGLLWGGSRPTKEHPEEFYAKGRYLVIWSFKKGSPLARASQEKVKAALK